MYSGRNPRGKRPGAGTYDHATKPWISDTDRRLLHPAIADWNREDDAVRCGRELFDEAEIEFEYHACDRESLCGKGTAREARRLCS